MSFSPLARKSIIRQATGCGDSSKIKSSATILQKVHQPTSHFPSAITTSPLCYFSTKASIESTSSSHGENNQLNTTLAKKGSCSIFRNLCLNPCHVVKNCFKEPSVMEEAKTSLDSMGMQGFYN